MRKMYHNSQMINKTRYDKISKCYIVSKSDLVTKYCDINYMVVWKYSYIEVPFSQRKQIPGVQLGNA